MNPGVAVEVTGVRRAFGPNLVLNGFELSAAPGEFVAVVGRSGSGKSTLLRLLAGLDRPDGGAVRVDGSTLDGLCPVARVVFQDGRLLPWLRVGPNVALGLPANGRERANEMLARVGLADRAADWPAVLSGGQRQRVALARALAGDPRLLLLDEPLGSLDALTRIEMQRLIEDLWSTGRFTTVLITHDVDEAVTLADRVVLIAAGRVTGEWPVPLPRPRRRDDPAFGPLVRTILDAVMTASTDKE
ncbi:ABC transporter ATP-binding protein [Frigoriglobus tundricola]|uniref:Alkanesulfonate ABC transporter ATP-binding protein SsuB n=1 Tax=Frigoriglobus tundricola TaxID=2774151 RepID=A0A6M5Z3X8_9BACT|nr:ABC transporter ATP-binding protein [Frigoriglobus tundricola]QJX01130.1 Alkanesulfonate ABC transporter ATP-binding protein SsuB [Frigoriglobus tundricola]